MAKAAPLSWLAAGLLLYPAAAWAECEDGRALGPGESCEITIAWGHDHWIVADFPAGPNHRVLFRHLEGQCNVALFGPEDAELGAEDAMLGPERPSISSTVPGEYHLFTRAIAVAQRTCRFEVLVN